MASAIELACANEPQLAGAKHLAAAKAAGFETLISVLGLDFEGMSASFPQPAAVQKFLAILIVNDNSIKADDAKDIFLASLLCFHVAQAHKAATPAAPPAPIAGTAAYAPALLSQTAIAAKERKESDAYGLRAYKHVETTTCNIWPAKYRVSGKDLQKTEDELNRGSISRESYKLNLQKSILVTDEDKTTAVTDELTFTIGAVPTEVVMKRAGQFLVQAHIFKGRMLGSGMRQVAPHPDNPTAGTQGTKCSVEVDDPASGPTATKTVKWHTTPPVMERWFMTAVEAISTMPLVDLNAVHESIQERTGGAQQEMDFNYGSALSALLDATTWHGVLASLPAAIPRSLLPHTPAPKADEAGGSADELKELRSERKRLANELEQSQRALKLAKTKASITTPTPPPPAASGRLCFDFQNNRCTRGASCNFQHVCERCGSTHHGGSSCTAPPPPPNR